MPDEPTTSRIRPYEGTDEAGWPRCRVLSFLSTPYFDDVKTSKDRYDNPAVELVAKVEEDIVGLLDLELETVPGELCWKSGPLGAVMWNIAVHPDHQREGIATSLLHEALSLAKRNGIKRIETWTRDTGPPGLGMPTRVFGRSMGIYMSSSTARKRPKSFRDRHQAVSKWSTRSRITRAKSEKPFVLNSHEYTTALSMNY